MTRLALPDATFFALETPSRPMHAGALMLFDPPAGEPAADFAARVVAGFRETAPVAPFNQRPDLTLGRLPQWVTVEAVDLNHHVRHIALPGQATRQQLMELVGHLYVALLDRSRPLWECYVIEGLKAALSRFSISCITPWPMGSAAAGCWSGRCLPPRLIALLGRFGRHGRPLHDLLAKRFPRIGAIP